MANPFSNKDKKFSIGVPFFGDNYQDFDRFFLELEGSDYKNFEVVVTFDGENKDGVKYIDVFLAKIKNTISRSTFIPSPK